MKRILILSLLSLFFISCTISPVYTDSYYQRERHYDDRGNYKGYSEQRQKSNRIRFYNEHGQYQGYAIESKYSTRYYDYKGRYKGKSD